MGILNSLLRGVTWWNGQTLNTQLFTWRKGSKVGEDAQGNIYYRNADDSKRWVIFNGEAANRQAADPQAVGKGACRESHRHRHGLCARRVAAPRRTCRA